MVSPLADYMPGVRKAIVVDLPRKRLALAQHRALAQRLKAEGYGQALVMPRTWKSALAPYLAGIGSAPASSARRASACSTICAGASARCRA